MCSALKHAAASIFAAAIVSAGSLSPSAQLRVQPIADQQGTVALGLMLRKLQTVGTLMMATAHPDDENSGLLAMTGLGRGWRTALVSATRGDGGQNEIGPELSDALAVLRTEELLAAHRFDGAEQYFTRAVDFGFSFSIEESYQKWGKEEILSDQVRMIRTIRPDVIVGFLWDGTGGGQHHQAATHLAAQAFRAAADPSRFPDQIQQGLRPWQARKFYYTASFGRQPPPAGAKTIEVDANVYDPLLGQTYEEIGAEARSMHKCQGMAQVLPLPGEGDVRRYVLQDTTLPGGTGRSETTLLDGIDATLSSLAAYAQPPPAALVQALQAVAGDITSAERAFRDDGPAAAASPLAAGLARLRELRAALASMALKEDARFEIDFRLAQKEHQFGRALVLAHGVQVDAVADDGLVVPGQTVNVKVRVAARGDRTSVRAATLDGFDFAPTCGGANVLASQCTFSVRVPANAALTTPYFHQLPNAARYEFDPDAPFGLPFRPTPFIARLTLELGGVDVPWETPIQYRYQGNIFSGEKRMDLTVVPVLALRASPEIEIVPWSPSPRRADGAVDREVRVLVTNHTKGPATGEARLEAPTGWKVEPAAAPVRFSREDEEVTVRFRVVPAGQAGDYELKASVRSGGAENSFGYQVIEYPHTQRRHLVEPASVRVTVLDVKVAPGLTVGYIMGVGDKVPPAIEQLGVQLDLLTPEDLAWGDLSKYDVIVTGVRAYERRQDLRAHNTRLMAYAERGGTVIVQYNKFEFNEAQYGPYPAKVSNNRVTDEHAPITVLTPAHPVFTTPNRIDAAAWDGWVQERGLYFLGERDSRYTDLLETTDTFEYNPGAKRGALVETRFGKGRWIYLGLNLWRQLPAGTPGAYKLLGNLLSLGTAARTAR
jgi:LmbE family N-acetylglucosaminyl deacetylase